MTARSILLVRHGETAGNAARVIQMPDAGLSERGLAQARLLAERLLQVPVERLVSSDYPRALRTAQAVAARLPGLAIELDPLLRERDFGDWRGQSYAVFGGANPFDARVAPPNGEDLATFRQRVARAWTRIVALAGELREGSLLVVTHGQMCRALVQGHVTLGGADEEGTLPLPSRWFNTSVTAVEGVPPWRALRVNCVAHLEPGWRGDAGHT
jgi:probable phosphoglycerate mutase